VSKCCFASNSGATSALAGSPGFTNPPPWHFSASPMQATVLSSRSCPTSTCTMLPTRTPVPVSTERGQNRREIGARANGSPGSPANFRPTSRQLKRTQLGAATISGKSKKSENGCWPFLFAFRCRGARSEHFCTDSWFQLGKGSAASKTPIRCRLSRRPS
jgi:hypothetical protein